ncbi:MAG: MCE family protein [Mycobacteriaceae bacterium]
MKSFKRVLAQFLIFAISMLMILAGLVVVFGQFRFDKMTTYHAIFTDSSGLENGQFVRFSGVEIGKVTGVKILSDNSNSARAVVDFEVGRQYRVTEGTLAMVRYQNLVGDRYLELKDGPGEMIPLVEDSIITSEKTSPALDLDVLIGSFKPLLQALEPEQINNLSRELIAVLQDQGGTLSALLARTASLTASLANRDQVISQVITNLESVMSTVADQGKQFSSALVNAQSLASGLAQDSQTWGEALAQINGSAKTISDLLTDSQKPLQGTVLELNRVSAQLDSGKETIASVSSRLPDAYAALSRLGAYGNFFNYYLCGIRIKLNGADGKPVTTPLIGQTTGRCAPA